METAVNKRCVGKAGEDAACSELERNGYTVLCRNYTCKGGEIDIIASKGEYLVFAEVKMRSAYGKPDFSAAEAVTASKAKRIKRAAQNFINEYKANEFIGSLKARIDIIEVYVKKDGSLSVRHSTTELFETVI